VQGRQPDHRATTIEAVSERALRVQGGRRPGARAHGAHGGFASSRILEVHGERMVKRNFEPGFRIGAAPEGSQLALQGALRNVMSLPVTAFCAQLFNMAAANGGSKWDHSGMAARSR